MKLFIDTTTNNVNITVFNDKIIQSFEYRGNNDHTLTVFETLSKIDLHSISDIYVTRGPGSYTGVRIGVLVAKTLAHELNARLHSINTLKLLYLISNEKIGLDARGKKLFTYDGNKFAIELITEANAKKIDESINAKYLLNKEVLGSFDVVSPNELKIEYMKDAI